MNKKITRLLAALALLAFMTPSLAGWGQTIPEVVTYTLDGTKTGTNNSYSTEGTVTQGGISWKVMGNIQQNPWRIGGRNITNTDRPIYSTGTIPANVTKIEVTHGTATQITVNSWTVIVATDASFNTVVSTLTPTFAASTTTTIERPDGANWTNCYYKFIYNVSVSGNTNRYFQFHDAKFYAPAPQLTITTPTGGTITVTDAQNNPVTSGDYVAPNAVFNIVATPNPGYAFAGWAATTGTLGSASNPSTTFTIGTIDATLSATFVEAYALTLHAEHGTITATDAQSNPVISGNYIAPGAVLNIVATPASGYEFNGWTVSGTGSSVNDATAAATTFTMGTANAELTASFTLASGPTYTYVKTSSIAVGDEVLLIYEGDKKELSGFTTTGTIYGQGTTYTTVPTGLYPLTVVAGYQGNGYAFKNSSNAYLYWTNSNSLQTNNTLSNNSSWNVSFSDGNATIANAATSARTIRWNNSAYGGNRFACYTDGTQNTQAVQLYKKVEMHPITITQPNDGNGTIAVFDADQNEVATGDFFFEGEVLTIEATPLPGYALDEWTATNGAVGDPHALTTTLTIGTGDVAITASFAADNTQYDVNIAQNIEHGSVVADQASCVSGYTVTLTISPDSGYNIESLTVTGNVSGNNIMISPALSLNETEYSFIMPAEAVTVNGTFTDRVIDELSIALIYPNMTSNGTSSYYNWTVSHNSNAVYAGNSSHTNQYIQLRNNSPAGIVSTASGGYVRRVAVSWAGTNTNNRAITVYGKNEPYTGSSDLYNNSAQGTSLGTLTYTTGATSAELEITGDYMYVGLRAGNELYINPVQIAWEDPSVSTTIAIDDSGITNTNIYGDNFAAGSLVATVKDNNDNPITGATVTWTSSNTGVATIANDGTVTLFSAGTTTITASYNGVLCQYKPSTATYVLEVINLGPNDPGGENNPYSVADAIAVAEAGGTSTNVYTHGTVSSFYGTSTNIMDGGQRYYISDDGTTTTQLLVYGGKGLNNVAFSNVNDLLLTDEVTIFGRLTKNGTTPEIAANNYIVSLSRGTTVTIDASGIENNLAVPMAGGTLVATVTDSQGNAITGATVTWTSSDEGVATINSNGEVTLVAAGTTTITATYAGGQGYQGSSATYDLAVINVGDGDPGSADDPYTVTEAIAATPSIGTTADVYVRGTVSGISLIINNADYYITDGTNTLFVSEGNGMGGSPFHTNGNDLLVGDEVVIKGGLTTKNNTEQFARGSQIVSLNRTIDGDVTYTDFTIYDGETITVKANVTLTLSGNTTIKDDGQLIIEDGGQLIHTGVDNATMKKGIKACGSKSTSGWYTIASPLATVDLTNDNPLITFTSNYDLYSYIESEHKWYNQKAHPEDFTTLSRGTGYLYANESAVDLAFTGTLLATDTKVPVPLSYAAEGDLKGYNLVGNPFSCNISGKVNLGSDPLTTYYAVTNGSEITSFTLSDTPILPCQGFFVQAANDGDILTFNPSGSKGERASKPAYVRIEAGDANFMDRAYVQIGQGNTLRKMSINDEVSHLYVMNHQADYAAATIEAAEGEMPVCFDAAYDGQYTITVSVKGFETNYLHLIDNLTGADIDLLINPSYSFSAKAGDNANRFTLVFGEGNSPVVVNEVFAYMSNGNIIITDADADATLQMVDMMGHVILSRNDVHSISASGIPAGVYVLRLINGNSIKIQKMVIQ